MTKPTTRALIALITAMAAGAAIADFKDGNKLYHQITNGDRPDWFNAIGYVTGVADALRGNTHCMPDNATAGQIMDMTRLEMERNPQLRHFPAQAIVAFTLKQAWPCERKGGQSL